MKNNVLFEDQIPLMKPWIGKEEYESLQEVLFSGWVSQGPKVQEFESELAKYVGAKFGVATNSCTSAMHLALRIGGVKEGDEVLVTDSTCMANANAIMMAGAKPVFVDIEEKTFNVDPTLFEEKITPRTRAIMGVDQVGLSMNLDAVNSIAKKYNLFLLDDAATALGGKFNGKYLGGHGIPTTYSFHPRKTITTGEGGMLMTNDESFANKARILRSAGASVSDLERHKLKGTVVQSYPEAGYNYRMTDIQAAIGLVQLKKIDRILAERKRQAEYFYKELREIEDFQLPYVPDYAEHAFSSFLILLKDESKLTTKQIVQFMSEKNISCRFGIQPLHREPAFEMDQLTDDMFPVSCKIAERSFFIPIFPNLSDSQLEYIVTSLKEAVKKFR